VPHGLLNSCSRVALKAFTIANTFPNMHDTKVQWIEWMQVGPNRDVTGWKLYMFQIDFEKLEGSDLYLNNEALTIELQRKFANSVGQQVKRFEIDAEGVIAKTYELDNKTTSLASSALTITISLIANTFSIEGKTSSGHRMIGLFTSQNSLWSKMGLTDTKLISNTDTLLQLAEKSNPEPIPPSDEFNNLQEDGSIFHKYHLRDCHVDLSTP
jgi:hypothetical protein